MLRQKGIKSAEVPAMWKQHKSHHKCLGEKSVMSRLRFCEVIRWDQQNLKLKYQLKAQPKISRNLNLNGSHHGSLRFYNPTPFSVWNLRNFSLHQKIHPKPRFFEQVIADEAVDQLMRTMPMLLSVIMPLNMDVLFGHLNKNNGRFSNWMSKNDTKIQYWEGRWKLVVCLTGFSLFHFRMSKQHVTIRTLCRDVLCLRRVPSLRRGHNFSIPTCPSNTGFSVRDYQVSWMIVDDQFPRVHSYAPSIIHYSFIHSLTHANPIHINQISKSFGDSLFFFQQWLKGVLSIWVVHLVFRLFLVLTPKDPCTSNQFCWLSCRVFPCKPSPSNFVAHVMNLESFRLQLVA